MTDSKSLTIELPWPPSTNTFLRHFLLPGRKHPSTCISEKGREFFKEVGRILIKNRLKLPKLEGPLAVTIEIFPKDRRKIDVDNRAKAVLDSLKRRPKDKKQFSGAWIFADDDSQVHDLRLILRNIVPNGKAIVTLTKLPSESQPNLFVEHYPESDGIA